MSLVTDQTPVLNEREKDFQANLTAEVRRSYDFGRVFLQEVGIDARLNKFANGCISKGYTSVIFNARGEYSANITVDVMKPSRKKIDEATIHYERSLGLGIEQDEEEETTLPTMVQSADLLTVLEKICSARGYYFRPSAHNMGDVSVMVGHRVPVNAFQDFAQFIRNTQWLISEYSSALR